jgi:hypothetical protein
MANAKIDKDQLYDMDLHEVFIINSGLSITRVLGGWVYTYTDVLLRSGTSSVFVREVDR